MSKPDSYSSSQILLHWIIAALIIAAWYTGDGMGRVLRHRLETGASGIEGNTVHVWIGGVVFVLVLIRLCIRQAHGAPSPLSDSTMMTLMVHWGHRILYLLMILVPGLGALAWYGRVGNAGEIHETLANAFMIVALGHAGFAIWHQFIKRDGTLDRMRLRVKGK